MNINFKLEIDYDEIDLEIKKFSKEDLQNCKSIRKWIEQRISFWERDSSSAERHFMREASLRELYAIRRILDAQFLPEHLQQHTSYVNFNES